MMTCKTLIHAVCADEKNFPHLSEIPLFLYDEKDRLNTDSDITFSEDLFADNFSERERFFSYLNDLEKNQIAYMDVQITASHVIVFSKTSLLKLFSRKQSSKN